MLLLFLLIRLMLPSQNIYLCGLRGRILDKKKIKGEKNVMRKCEKQGIADHKPIQAIKNRYSEQNQAQILKKCLSTDRNSGGLQLSSQLGKKFMRNPYLRKTEAYDKENESPNIHNLIDRSESWREKKNNPMTQRNEDAKDFLLKNVFHKPKMKEKCELLRTIRSEKQKKYKKTQNRKLTNKTNPQNKCLPNPIPNHKKQSIINKVTKSLTYELKKIRYETASIKGSKSVNQDYIKCDDNIWILCDGHGQYGHQISEFVCEVMMELCKQLKNKNILSVKTINKMFGDVEEMLEESQIDIYLSGSTCTLIVYHNNQLFCANVGDSPAIFIMNQENSYQQIFTEHKPGKSEERKRIDFFGGQVKKHPSKVSIKQSPLRLWGSNQDCWGPGLAVSRAFGDKMAKKYGLISEPSIKTIPMISELKNIVIGSDGFFDKVCYNEAEYLIQRESSSMECREEQLCTTLAKIAKQRWSVYSDDVSVVLIYF